MSTIRANAILDSAGGNTATINGITPALSSQAQAEAGTDNTTLMTPLRVTQAVLAELNATGAAPVYACRAWANFNGVTTVTIRASGNISSIVRTAASSYTINFTSAMPHANFVLAGVTGAVQFNIGYGTVSGSIMPRTTTSVQIVIGNGDQADIQFAIFC